MIKFTVLFFTIMCLALSMGTVNAHHMEGAVYCDVNRSETIDAGDLPLEGVCVNVLSADAGTVDRTDCTDAAGSYYVSLPSTKPALYDASLISGLPADAVFIIPPVNLHSFALVEGHTVEVFDWLIDSAICHDDPVCGDEEINQESETCEPPGSEVAPGVICRDDCTYCGDDRLDDGEMCDDGNNVDGDGCDANCQNEPVCGDEEINQESETCEPPGSEVTPDGPICRDDCTYCGDDRLDDGEMCDDGNNIDGDGCDADCMVEEEGGEGCTPGYWKVPQHFDSWNNYLIGQSFSSVFGEVITIKFKLIRRPVPITDPTLLQALWANGGGINALARHAVAGLLNASSPDVSYAYSTGQIIDMVQAAIASGDYEMYKDMLEYENDPTPCPLN